MRRGVHARYRKRVFIRTGRRRAAYALDVYGVYAGRVVPYGYPVILRLYIQMAAPDSRNRGGNPGGFYWKRFFDYFRVFMRLIFSYGQRPRFLSIRRTGTLWAEYS